MARSPESLADVEYDFVKLDDPAKKAILFRIDGKDVWLPRAHIEVDAEEKVVTMPEWLAIERDLV